MSNTLDPMVEGGSCVLASCRNGWPSVPALLRTLLILGVTLNWGILRAADSEVHDGPSVRLSELSIEELVNVEITSVAKKPTPLSEAPASVAVLTQEDIRRLGATSIPEAFRAVPGLAVARLNANKWAISSRSFNDEYANKLLVLVDGRSVYTPSFGGVYWNAQDLVLEDLDRIEVIRGPGATLWGANAVNGVINIITKSAKETQGALLSSSFGTEDQPSLSARYGGQLASNLYYRVFAKYFNRDGFSDTRGWEMGDDWRAGRGGLRLDWEPSGENTFTLLGDYFDGRFAEPISRAALFPPTNVLLQVEAPMRGGYALGRWQRKFSAESELKVQAYFDHHERDHPFGGAMAIAGPDLYDTEHMPGESRDTWDLDLQHRFALGDRQDLVWGAGYRYTEDRYLPNGTDNRLVPDRRGDQLFNVFLQDEIAVLRDRLRLTLGSKFEHNDYTGLEVQPGARLLWTPTEHHSIWASVARAVRTPTRFDWGAEANLAAVSPALIQLHGSPNLTSEKLVAYEVGYRVKPISRLSLDLSAFYNDYQSIGRATFGAAQFDPVPLPHLIIPVGYVNHPHGSTHGVEALARWAVTDYWRLTGGYAWLHSRLPAGIRSDQDAPAQQFHLHSSLDLSHGWELDAALYYVDQIAVLSANFFNPTPIPAYARLDVGLSWRPHPRLELAVWGQNLLDSAHPEFGSYKTTVLIEIPRTFYGKITWRF